MSQVFLEEDGEVLVFANPSRAAIYLMEKKREQDDEDVLLLLVGL